MLSSKADRQAVGRMPIHHHALCVHTPTRPQVDLTQFMGYNKCFAAGADKGIAYELYNR